MHDTVYVTQLSHSHIHSPLVKDRVEMLTDEN